MYSAQRIFQQHFKCKKCALYLIKYGIPCVLSLCVWQCTIQWWGAWFIVGENLRVAWAKFSCISWSVLSHNKKMLGMYMTISKVENSAQVCPVSWCLSMTLDYNIYLWVRHGLFSQSPRWYTIVDFNVIYSFLVPTVVTRLKPVTWWWWVSPSTTLLPPLTIHQSDLECCFDSCKCTSLLCQRKNYGILFLYHQPLLPFCVIFSVVVQE